MMATPVRVHRSQSVAVLRVCQRSIKFAINALLILGESAPALIGFRVHFSRKLFCESEVDECFIA
jgi:hypothetical protein